MCNTDPINEKGTHWVAYWFRNPYECEFYDSFGRRPEAYDSRLRDFVDRNALLYLYNDEQVQPDSTVTCGLHVIFFLYCRTKNIPMKEVIRKTSETLVQNVVQKGIRFL